jgi:3-methyladenine DNA glycosylase AlkD
VIDTDLVTAARSGLAELADPVAAPQMQRYMKSALPFYGAKAPAVRVLLRQLVADHPLESRADWADTVRALYDEAGHREERYVALGIAGHRRYRLHRDHAALPLYQHLAVLGAWWDLVDTVASHVGEILMRDRESTEPVVREWATDPDPWLRRVAILSQLKHRTATDTALLAAALDANLDERAFFIRKAIGWALREYSKTDPEWVRDYVETRRHGLSALSIREASKYLGG